jgi:hypothetical protein
MANRHLRRSLLTLLALSAAAIAACSGGNGVGTGGDGGKDTTSSSSGGSTSSGGDAMAIASDAFAVASIQPGTGGLCAFAQQATLLDVGVATSNQPSTVANGGSQAGAKVTVACAVHPHYNGYDIDLNVELVARGALHVFSTGPGAVTSSGGTGISAAFSTTVGGSAQTYSADDCTLTYMYQAAPISNPMPVAPGRIWGHVSCPNAQAMTDVLLPDGGTVPQQCDAEADFLFENCSQ